MGLYALLYAHTYVCAHQKIIGGGGGGGGSIHERFGIGKCAPLFLLSSLMVSVQQEYSAYYYVKYCVWLGRYVHIYVCT